MMNPAAIRSIPIAPPNLGGAIGAFVGAAYDNVVSGVAIGFGGSQEQLAHFFELTQSTPRGAQPYLDDNPEFRGQLEELISERTIPEAARMQRFVNARGRFFMPRLFFDPESVRDDTVGSIAELDDVDVARIAFDFGVRKNSLSSEEARVAAALEYGGALYARLMDAIEREVIAWPDLFDIDIPEDSMEQMRAGKSPGSIHLIRASGLHYLSEIIRDGYDPERRQTTDFDGIINVDAYDRHYGVNNLALDDLKGGYFFRSTDSVEEFAHADSFYFYGLGSIRHGITAAIEHGIPIPLLLTYLAAANGSAYDVGMEFAIMDEGTRLFDAMLTRHSGVSTRIRMYSFPDTEEARSAVEDILGAGTEVYFDLGSSFDRSYNFFGDKLLDLYTSLIPQELGDPQTEDIEELIDLLINSPYDLVSGEVGTDENNEEIFFLTLLLHDTDKAYGFFETMVEENEEMAERASIFYASLPGYSLQRLLAWQEAWAEKASAQLNSFLDETIAKARSIAERYQGKTLTPDMRLITP